MTHQDTAKSPTGKGIGTFLDKLDTGHVLTLVGVLFLLDLAIPDPLPFVDEIFLGALALLVARWQSRRKAPGKQATWPGPGAQKPPRKNVTETG